MRSAATAALRMARSVSYCRRTVRGAASAAQPITSAWTSLGLIVPSPRESSVGSRWLRRMDSSRAQALGRLPGVVSHFSAQRPNVTRASAGSMYAPESLACSTDVSHRSASTRRANVLDRSRLSGSR